MLMKCRSALKAIGLHLPFVQTITYYGHVSQIEALWKFLILWSFSALPLLFAAIAPAFSRNETQAGTLEALNTEFSSTSVLVYSVSYLVPFLYAGCELVKRQMYFAFSRKEAPKNIDFPGGYSLLFYISAIVFIFTTFTYKRGGGTAAVDTLMSGWVKWLVYLYSVACWYVTLLIESGANTTDGSRYSDLMRQSSSDLSKGLSEHLDAEDQE